MTNDKYPHIVFVEQSSPDEIFNKASLIIDQKVDLEGYLLSNSFSKTPISSLLYLSPLTDALRYAWIYLVKEFRKETTPFYFIS